MQFYKLYMKIAWNYKKSVIIYLSIFLGFFMLFQVLLLKNPSTNLNFTSVKPDIAIVDKDNSESSKKFISYLKKQGTVQKVGNTSEELKDALFYGIVSYVVEIPENFEENFMNGNKPEVYAEGKKDNANTVILDMRMNSYLSQLSVYQKANSDLTAKELGNKVNQQMNSNVDVHIIENKEVINHKIFRGTAFNYFSYIAIAILIQIIGITMTALFKTDVLKRNSISPVTTVSMNMQLLLANITMGIIIWLSFMGMSLFVFGKDMFSRVMLIHVLNSFIFSMMAVAMSFMISCLLTNVKNRGDVLNGISNAISLTFAFLGGAFVPQMLISDSILAVSKFIPTYWYVKLNDILAYEKVIPWNDVFVCLGIEVLFLLAFASIALLILKNKRSQDEFVYST